MGSLVSRCYQGLYFVGTTRRLYTEGLTCIPP